MDYHTLGKGCFKMFDSREEQWGVEAFMRQFDNCPTDRKACALYESLTNLYKDNDRMLLWIVKGFHYSRHGTGGSHKG